MSTTETSDVVSLLEQTLAYSRERDYTGYDKADGLSSPIRSALPVDSKWVNFGFQELAKRAPVNVRPVLLVPKRRSYKGTALFALANLSLWAHTGEDRYRSETADLLTWLVENRSRGYAGLCGGHQHPYQTPDATVQAGTPDVVDTSFAVRALLRGGPIYREGAEIAESAADFLYDDLGYHEVPAGARIRYKPIDGDDHFTLNANALGARLLVDIYASTGDDRHRERAEAILSYVVSRQREAGGWPYRDPPASSHLSMDNYHNGFILESLHRYGAVVDRDRFASALRQGLAFFRDSLWENGAPRWDEANRYPRDVHAAAQGIVVFSRVGDLARARQVIDWVCDHLYAGDGRFYYQKRRYYTKRFTLMRWCQAWMAHALGTYLRCASVDPPGTTVREDGLLDVRSG